MAAYADHFTIHNIPFGIASSEQHQPQCVSRIENTVIFLAVLAKAGFFQSTDVPLYDVLNAPTLNAFAALPKSVQRDVRSKLQRVFLTDEHETLPESSTAIIDSVRMHLPVAIGDFTDFSASREHVLNAGEAVLGRRLLPPGFLHYPIGYGGRASSIVVSGTPIERPIGQFKDRSADSDRVVCEPSKAVDYELEIAAIIGKPVKTGQRVHAANADEHIFGLVMLNDWSARDIQALEMNPLGPLNSKNFGTSVSAWVVTLDALEPFRTAAPPRDQPVASYLHDPRDSNFAVELEVEILSGDSSTLTCRTQLRSMYWTFRQMVAHHTVGGCNLNTGDLIASGTVSGAEDMEHGCLLEFTQGGKKDFRLTDGSSRVYLCDGDIVKFTGRARGAGLSIGFGDCIGQVNPARPLPDTE